MTARACSVQFIYDDKMLVAVIEPVEGGWRLIWNGREIGIYAKREQALAAIDGGER